MYSLIQVYLIIFFLFLYVAIAAIPAALVMAAITYKTKDKAYFRKKIDKLIKG
ncbi:hypothetical protein ACQPVP_15910 [Clostridium nigeriense]|uniref:hypothetical protein n=1 Tax=Clostridium nigeriense TaxID=1805470 RepID=UPI003D324CB3